MRVGPPPLDGEALGVGDVVRAFLRVHPGDDQELDALGLEVGEPALVVGVAPVPAGPGIRPGRRRRRPGRPVVIVHEPVAMAVDVDVSNLVPEPRPEEIIGNVRPRIGDAGTRGPRSPFQVQPARVIVPETGDRTSTSCRPGRVRVQGIPR